MNPDIKTDIIPVRSKFAKVDAMHELNLEAICVFAAIGFFLDQDTYWKDQIVLSPASINKLDVEGNVVESSPWFKWHYSPRDITFNQALEEFTDLFETIVKEQTQGKKVILPLSGGLDSRTQAVALKYLGADVVSYSYSFDNGYDEAKIGRQIAESCGFDFKGFSISKGYLWKHLDELVALNQCYSDFTTPRQMALFGDYAGMGDVFSLGHWGDVMFDNLQADGLKVSGQVDLLLKKIVKRGGVAFASELWNLWGLDGEFESYLRSRMEDLLERIDIDNANARLRAFKSLYWAPRWTSVNLSIFSAHRPVALPYYDERMCEFICTIPESYLAGRQLQIEYIKTRAPELAKVTWEAQRPFNLNTFNYNKAPYNLPYKVLHKLKREFNSLIGHPYVQRNWELQFLGDDNQRHLEAHLFNGTFNKWVPKSFVDYYYNRFTSKDPLANAHAINILLVLSKFDELNPTTSSV